MFAPRYIFAPRVRSRNEYERLLRRLLDIDTQQLSDSDRWKIWNARAYYKRRAAGLPAKPARRTRERQRVGGRR